MRRFLPSAAGPASRPRGRPGTAGRGRAGRRAARRSTTSPGRCGPEALRSGPTPKGTTATTARKNSTPSSAPPPARSESLRSRANSAPISPLPRPGTDRRSPAPPGPSDRGPADGRRRGRAAGGSRRPGCRRLRDGLRTRPANWSTEWHVHRRCRLVEDPDRAVDRQQPGQRDAPLLAGRQIAVGQMLDAAEADGSGRLLDRHGGLAFRAPQPGHETPPEQQVLAHREIRFHRVAMAEIVAGLADRLAIDAFEAQVSARAGAATRRSRAAASTCRRRSAP